MKKQGLKTYSLDEITDKHIGKRGTPKREAFAQLHHMQGSPLSGIIIHGNGDFLPAFHQKFTRRDYIDQYRIPVIATTLDTYGAAMKIGKIEVKINTRTLWKADRAVDLFEKYVNIEPLLT